jgi:guanylate kinase
LTRRPAIENRKSKWKMSKGPLIILSGPAGSGKSTVVERLLERARHEGLPLRVSVSATTRPPRPYEADGVHYHFWTPARFDAALREGAFLESAQVHGACYGTPRSEVEGSRETGVGVILVIDVQGAAQVRATCPDSVSVFLRPPSPEVLEQRLRGRGTESEAAIQRRLENARRELARSGEYDYEVVNDDVETAVGRLLDIIGRQFERGGHAG